MRQRGWGRNSGEINMEKKGDYERKKKCADDYTNIFLLFSVTSKQ